MVTRTLAGFRAKRLALTSAVFMPSLATLNGQRQEVLLQLPRYEGSRAIPPAFAARAVPVSFHTAVLLSG
jgi:hypothetical protein